MKFPYRELKQRMNYFLLKKGNTKNLSMHILIYIFEYFCNITRSLVIVLIFEIILLQHNEYQNTESFDVIAPY